MNHDNRSNNKRIAQNTIILYTRTLFVLIVKLYTSRLILKYLGVEDYGIYNIVGAFIAMFTIFNGSLTTSIQRFLTFSLGRNNEQEVRDVFSVSLTILLALSIIIVLVAETIGLWYINNIMEIPSGRLIATNIVYQFSIITFVFEVITVPYNSILTAYENFKAFAYFDILNTIMALFLVLSLPFVALDSLIYYGLGLLIIAIVIRLSYSIYCHKHYVASHFHFVKDRHLYRSLFSFSFYSFFGNIGTVIGEGGINIVINLFFGVTLNATRGISTQVSNVVGGFVRSFTTALNPQITKTYADGDMKRCSSLVFNSAKFSFLLLTVGLIPVVVNVHFILDLWLTTIPPYSEIFVRLMLLQSLIHILFNPITTVVNATGNIKHYQIGTFLILISNIIFIYIVYLFSFPAYYGIIVQCIVTFIQLIYSMLIMEPVTGIKSKEFLIKVVIPCFIIFALCLCTGFFFEYGIKNLNLPYIYSIIISTISTIIICGTLGFTQNQRDLLFKYLTKKIKR